MIGISVGDRVYVYKINKTPVKIKGLVVEIHDNLYVDADGWYYDINWCKPILVVKDGVIVGK